MGFLQLSPQVFYNLEPIECLEVLKKAKEKYKIDHRLMYIAITNALGSALDKNYKYKDVFENSNVKKEVDEDEKQRLKEYFENW